jgi:hypothetical protein
MSFGAGRLDLQAGPCETMCSRHPEPVRACNARPPWFVPAPQRCPGDKTPGRWRSVAHQGDLRETRPGSGTGNELRITASNSGDGANRRIPITVLATGPTVKRARGRRKRTRERSPRRPLRACWPASAGCRRTPCGLVAPSLTQDDPVRSGSTGTDIRLLVSRGGREG